VNKVNVKDSLDEWVKNKLILGHEHVFRIDHNSLRLFFLLKIASEESKPNVLREGQRCVWVEFIEEVPVHEPFHLPDDIHPNQWYLNKIRAEQAWDENTGN